jgi:quercetin dioxygenase-like cupin family protein
MRYPPPCLALLALLVLAGLQPARAQDVEYQKAGQGTRWLESGALQIKMLVEAATLGSDELEIGEITFPATGRPGGQHGHTSTEIFYILSGTLRHTVNGESHDLTPGMVGIVRAGDQVIHHVVSDEPVKALVIWLPGGEAERLVGFGFQERPVEQ